MLFMLWGPIITVELSIFCSSFWLTEKLPQTLDEADLCQNNGLDTVHLSDQS